MTGGSTLELFETLLGSLTLGDLENVETNSLGQGPAFADGDDIADLDVSVRKIAHVKHSGNVGK